LTRLSLLIEEHSSKLLTQADGERTRLMKTWRTINWTSYGMYVLGWGLVIVAALSIFGGDTKTKSD